MSEFSIGDLAYGFMLRRQNTDLKQSLTRLTTEMASGVAVDTAAHLSGRFELLSGFERSYTLLETYRVSASEAGTAAGVMQTALGTVADQTAALTDRLVPASSAVTSTSLETTAQTARGNLDAMISALNTSIGGRALFSGTLVSGRPLSGSDTLLDELRTNVSGLTTSADILAAADNFFDTPGGDFETMIYQGGNENLAPRELGSGETVRLDIRADDPILRSAMKVAAVAALVDDPALAFDPGEAQELLTRLTEQSVAAQSGVTALRADLGYAEERIEGASARIAAEIASVDLARRELVSVDPYQTATELEAVQIQIETLYTLTARSSRLSLVNFLS